jgi:hypothetical protein
LEQQFEIAAHFIGDVETDKQAHGACYSTQA